MNTKYKDDNIFKKLKIIHVIYVVHIHIIIHIIHIHHIIHEHIIHTLHKHHIHMYKDQWDDFCFQTPFKGGTTDPIYSYSYKDMAYLVGYTKQEYYSNRIMCNVSVYTRFNKKKVKLGKEHE